MKSICFAVACLSITSVAAADTINVPVDQPTIAAAISAAANGDVINIDAGTYIEHSLNPGGKAITIQGTLNGDGTLASTIDANGDGRVFSFTSGETTDTVIKDLVITGGSAGIGGGIFCNQNSNPTISGCLIEGNTAGNWGGGIYCDTSNPTISGSQVCGNAPSQIDGFYTDGGGNTVADECPAGCPADLNGDGAVTAADITVLLQSWATAGGDLNGDGTTTAADITVLLQAWGPCR